MVLRDTVKWWQWWQWSDMEPLEPSSSPKGCGTAPITNGSHTHCPSPRLMEPVIGWFACQSEIFPPPARPR